MTEPDPHIHVERKVLEAGPEVRNLISSMLGRATDAPNVVTTGCGRQVPYAMTSPRPESTTRIACRDHAHRDYLRFAEQFERLGQGAMATVSEEQVTAAVQRLRDLAKRFTT